MNVLCKLGFHKYIWDEPEDIKIGQKGRTEYPNGLVILHGERWIVAQWGECQRCGKQRWRQKLGSVWIG